MPQAGRFLPDAPAKKKRPSKLDPYKPLIRQWIEDDSANWRKQRHAAKRIWQRPVEECGADASASTVGRYAKTLREENRAASERFLDLAWEPGEAQADSGEADFCVIGVRKRLGYFVLTSPCSNVGLAQVFPGESAECVCQAPKGVFSCIGGVPKRTVFDSAAGVGRRTADKARTTGLFGRFAAHCGFACAFCNPASGHEKGSVENKVGSIRRSLFAPVPQATNMEAFNRNLLGKCMAISRKDHWAKGEPEDQLFVEDRFALSGLPAKPFEAVRYATARADKKGKARADGPHFYSTDPAFSGCEMLLEPGADKLRAFDGAGAFACEHARAYGDAPTDTADPGSQLRLLRLKPAGWRSSRVRAALPEEARGWMDGLGRDELKGELRLLRDETARSGWEATRQAVELAYGSTGRADRASVAAGAAGIASGAEAIAYDEPVDLSGHDAVFLGKGAQGMGCLEQGDATAPRALMRSMHSSADAIDSFLGSATAGQAAAVARTIRHEMQVRKRRRQERLARKARFPRIKPFEGYDFAQAALPEGCSVDGLKSLALVDAAQDFVFHGQTGRGKTHLAIAVGLACVNAGLEARFFTAAELALSLARANRGHRLEQPMKGIAKSQLLIIDGLGHVPLDQDGARLLFQVASDCYEKRSLVITANIEFSKWGAVFGGDKLASAITDRVMHHGRLVEFNGTSKRMDHAMMLGKKDD